MDIKSLRRNTNLTVIAEPGDGCSFGDGLHIHVLKDQYRCISAEFERQTGVSAGSAVHEQFAHARTARETDLPDGGIVEHGVADRRCIAEDQV